MAAIRRQDPFVYEYNSDGQLEKLDLKKIFPDNILAKTELQRTPVRITSIHSQQTPEVSRRASKKTRQLDLDKESK